MDASATQLPAQARNGALVQRLRMALGQAQVLGNQPGLRRALPAIAVVLAVAVAAAAWLLLAPAERLVLQNGLPEAEKARAFEALVGAGMDAQLDSGSGALTVPAAQFHKARMLLATQGLPQGAPDGLSTISDMPMGTSRQVEAARLRRMQELDLARSIMELQPVRSARVHLALPERSAFVREQGAARASVFVELAPGLSLSQAQVRAIVSLVSAAVPEMPGQNVSVVDSTGALLTRNDSDPMQAEADQQMQYRTRLEQMYRARVLALLTPMVGVGNAAVEVTVDMDFSRSEITKEEFLPQTALRSEQVSTQVNSGAAAVGVPGALANTPPPEGQLQAVETAATQASGSQSRSEAATRNFEVGRRVETRQPQSATITRIHAAVLVHKPVAPLADAPAEGTPSPVSAADPLLAQVETLTRSAIGFDSGRGDVVTITSVPFVQDQPLPELPWYTAAWLPDMGRVLLQLAVLAIVVLGVVRPILNRLLPPANAVAIAGAGPAGFADALEVPKGETMQALRRRLETAAPTAEDLDGAITYEEKIELVRQMAQAETNRIAGVFKDMLADRDKDEN